MAKLDTTAKATPGAAATTKPVDAPKPAEVVGGNGEGKKRTSESEAFQTAQACLESCASKEKGPRQAFQLEVNGKTVYLRSANPYTAKSWAFDQLVSGAKCLRIDSPTRAPRVVGVDAVMATVNALPEKDREAILNQLKAIMGAKS